MKTNLKGMLLVIALLGGMLAACNKSDPASVDCRDSKRVKEAIASETSPDITVALQAFVGASSKAERDSAIDALVKIGPRVIIPLFSLRKDSCYWGNDLIDGMHEVSRRIGAPAIPQLITILKTSESEPGSNKQAQVVSIAADALGKFGKSVIPQLTPLLKNQNVEVRMNATKALSAIGKPAIPQLISISKQDSDKSVRNTAAEALKELENKTTSK